ncbi:hypothetical protein LSH36_2112g00000 [Paralvinella palmiformis]|uniref:Uncharacterized protein n=1 Tax=Paralvinella palmiformis TaxID=53620 RepID=A0AAD9IQY8_9ANNE|nr:hypothetical protein LSH36_2112g00000 [Paralvinella palmiformis]
MLLKSGYRVPPTEMVGGMQGKKESVGVHISVSDIQDRKQESPFSWKIHEGHIMDLFINIDIHLIL